MGIVPHLSADQSVTTFSKRHSPVARVPLGQAFTCDTHDCYAGQISSERVLRPHIDMVDFNRATGPVYIEGVRAGDSIRVEIEAIELSSPGIMAVSPGLGVLGDQVLAPSTRFVPLRDGRAWLSEQVSVAVSPMIGVLGIAPAGDAISTSFPGTHGGNLDTRILTAGSALLLRAEHDGGLLAVGDLHAAQGDGELGGTGIEIGGSVRLRVEPSNHQGTLPAIVNEEGLFVLASAPTLDDAIKLAFDELVALLAAWQELAWEDAYRLGSLIARTHVSQVVNPLVTVRMLIPREWCPANLWGASDVN